MAQRSYKEIPVAALEWQRVGVGKLAILSSSPKRDPPLPPNKNIKKPITKEIVMPLRGGE